MKMGIVCDLTYHRSIALSTYYHALKNLYGDLLLIQKPTDLNEVKVVFICNEHFIPHRSIWLQPWFLDICNRNKIKVIVISGETLKNNIQSYVEQFNDLHQYVWDVNDCIIMERKRINYGVSWHYKNIVDRTKKKNNKCVFIGQMPPHYKLRIALIEKIHKYIDIDVITTGVGDNWEDYMNVLSQYRFVLSPISGASNGIPLRFYESLLAGCIPIQQVMENTLSFYKHEANLVDAIYFQDVEELPDKLQSCFLERATSELWLEDSIREAFIADKLHEVLENIR
jgi:hypothetical protein